MLHLVLLLNIVMTENNFLPSNVSLDNSECILNDIHKKSKNIVIYDRNIDSLQSDITELMRDSFEYRVNGSRDEICTALASDLSSYFSEPYELVKDIKKLVDLFYNVTKTSSFSLLLATVNTNMCKRFHTDMNDLRMLCTYKGPGTLWLTEDNVNREAFYLMKGEGIVVQDETSIQQVKTGAVAILKGAIYPSEGTKAIVHRSPTIEENGETRLLLRIDTNDFLGNLIKYT